MDAFIELKNVVKRYTMGDVTIYANNGVNFKVNKGEFTVIVGASGAGKTTILNMLGGMDTPTSGTIVVDGHNIATYDDKQLTDYRRDDIGFVFQFYNLVQNLTALENVELASQGGIKTKYKELISSFDDFDIQNPPTILNNNTNFYQMGWAGATTLASVSLFEVVDKLNIEFELQYNVPALKRNGIEVNSLPPIHKKKTWTYSNSLDQAEIYNSVAKEIEYLCSL